MANGIRNYRDAKDYAINTIDNADSLAGIDYVKFSRALKVFANGGDREDFCKLTDKYFELASNCGNKAFVKDSRSFLWKMCLAVDNTDKNGYTELHPRKMKRGSAATLFEDIYFNGKSKEQIASLMEKPRNQVVNIKHNVEGYTLEQVYNKIEDFSKIISRVHPDRINDVEKVWNDDKNEMNFNFYSRGYNISGHIQLKEKELGARLLLPPVVKPYVDGIKRKTEQKLEQILPRLSVSIQ